MGSKTFTSKEKNTIRLGSLKLETDLFIAPLMDVTTPSFIQLCKHYGGVGFYTMPMVFVNQIVAAPKTVRPYAEFVEQSRPSSLQIVGSGKSIEDIERAVDLLNSYDFDLIDINCGCPARHTCNSGGGASLMKSHRYNDLQTLVRTTIKTSNKPVSVKIRVGWDSDEGLKEIVKMIEDEGASFITVHGRVAKQGYSGIVNLDAIKLVKDIVNIPVVGNGDIYDYNSYIAMKESTGVDAVMIGRASMGNPIIFRDIVNKVDRKSEHLKFIESPETLETLKNYKGLPPVFTPEFREKLTKINTIDEIREYVTKILEFIDNMNKFWNNKKFKAIEIKRNSIWMLKGMYNAAKIRQRLGKTKLLDDLVEYIFSDEIISDLTPEIEEI